MRIRLLLCGAAMLAGACSAEDQEPPPRVPAIESQKGLVGLDPCTLLGPDALAEHGLAKGVPGQDELGANCRWSGRSKESVRLTAFTSGKGLTELVEDGDPAASRVRLSGYPALETFTAGGEFCRYDVGVGGEEAIVATMDGGKPDSCTALQALLSAVLSRLPATG